jgi:hypothetical protein
MSLFRADMLEGLGVYTLDSFDPGRRDEAAEGSVIQKTADGRGSKLQTAGQGGQKTQSRDPEQRIGASSQGREAIGFSLLGG